jgi:parallel beta-helix repeat protein
MKSHLRLSAACLTLLALLPGTAYPRTWHVRQDGTGDTAYLDFAVYSAQAGDTVLVGPGRYLQHPLYMGAIHLISEAGPEVTTIELLISDLEWDVHVIVIGNVGECSVQGFTIRGARNGWLSSGGGIDIIEASALIKGNIITDNWCASGGGLACAGSPSPVIEDNLFYGNGAFAGAAIHISQCSPIVRNNTIVDNHANDGAGAIYLVGAQSFPVIVNNIIVGNTAAEYGAIFGDTPAGLTFSCNDMYGNVPRNYDEPLSDQTGLNGNISQDPMFCGVAGTNNYYLQASSPCAEANVPADCAGVRMGCYPVRCTVGARKESWGTIRSLFKDGKR